MPTSIIAGRFRSFAAVSAMFLSQVFALTSNAQTVEARLLGDEKGYRVEPATINVPVGGSVRFVLVSGAPHNIVFQDTLPQATADRLAANMPATLTRLSGTMLLDTGETYTIPLTGLPPGRYGFHCMPHYANGERGVIVISGPAQMSTDEEAFVAVPAEVERFFVAMAAAQEEFFLDTARYAATFRALRLAKARLLVPLPPGYGEPEISLAVPGSWAATIRSSTRTCALGVNIENPLGAPPSTDAIDRPACRQRTGSSEKIESNADLAAFQAIMNAGVQAANNDRDVEAIARFREGLTLNPWHIDALSNLAIMHLKAERGDSALPFVMRLFDVAPNNPDINSLKALAYAHQAKQAKTDQQGRHPLVQAPLKFIERTLTDSAVAANRAKSEQEYEVRITEFRSDANAITFGGAVTNMRAIPRTLSLDVEFLDRRGLSVERAIVQLGAVGVGASDNFRVSRPANALAVAFRYRIR